MKFSPYSLSLLVLTTLACGSNPEISELQFLDVPTQHSGESNLFVSEESEVYLSWVEYLNDTTDALLYARLEEDRWSEPQEIVRGSNWFVNWADFPSLVARDGGKHLAAHWLQKSANGTYDYDVHIRQSQNGGETWDSDFIIHRDSIAAEHGFVIMLPVKSDGFFAVWLDGRNTKSQEETGKDETGHELGGAMTLRTAEFDKYGNIRAEAELDNRVCDCCQTDAAMTDQGPIVVYRDRKEFEIRDISIVRKSEGKWTNPHTVHADNWEIAGCPVNGPAIAAEGGNVALAWFTAAGGEARVNLAFSEDSGNSFSAPVQVSGHKSLGRVDVVLWKRNEAIVSWLEQEGEQGSIYYQKFNSSGAIGKRKLLSETPVARKSGFPVMEKTERGLIFSWTASDSLSRVRTAMAFLTNS